MLDVEEGSGFTPEEEQIIASAKRSKMWRLFRDALCLERERIYARRPTTTEELWAREGELRQVQRLLHTGPLLLVYYQRYVRSQTERGEAIVKAESSTPPPGEPPTVEE